MFLLGTEGDGFRREKDDLDLDRETDGDLEERDLERDRE